MRGRHMGFRLNEDSLTMLDGQWLRSQVDSHLIFGPLSKRFDFGWMVVLFFAVNLFASLPLSLSAAGLPTVLEKGFFLAASLIFYKISRYRQAAIGWCLTKGVLAVLCFIMLLAGGVIGLFQQKPDAIHAILLSCLWFPGPEFIRRVRQNQKVLTVARLTITPLILYFWYRTGTWH